MGWRRAIVLVAAAALGAGCSGGHGAAHDAVPRTTAGGAAAAEASTTTEAATPTTTFAQADDPPELVNTGEDFDAIVRSFLAYGEWLSVHPTPELVGEIYRSGGPAWSHLHAALTELKGRGFRTDGENPAVVTETRVVERPNNDLAIVYVVIDNPAYSVIDEDGDVVERAAADPLTSWAYELRRADGRWLVENRTVLGEVP